MSDDELTLTFEAPFVGERWISDEVQRVATHVRRSRRKVEVFGATARAMTRARVTYLEHDKAVLVGRRFLFEVEGGAMTVHDERGEPLPPHEAAALEEDRRRFGPVDRLGALLARRRYRRGEPVELPPAEVARVLGGDLEVTRLVVTYVERRPDGALCELALDARDRRGAVMTLSGTVRVDPATSRVRELRLGGRVQQAPVELVVSREAIDA